MATEHTRTFICEEDDIEYFYVTSSDGITWIESESEFDYLPERCYIYNSIYNPTNMYVDKTLHPIGGTGDWEINVMIGNGFKYIMDYPMSYGVPFNAVFNLFNLKVGQHPDLKIKVTHSSKGVTYALENGEAWIRCPVNTCSCLHTGEGDWEPIYVYNDTMAGIYNDNDEESLVLFKLRVQDPPVSSAPAAIHETI
jgi:hypothetical protein